MHLFVTLEPDSGQRSASCPRLLFPRHQKFWLLFRACCDIWEKRKFFGSVEIRTTITKFDTGHDPVRGRLYTVGLFDGDPICRFCGMETETVQHICCCEALVRQRYNVFGRPTVEPKDISTASIRDLCLFIRGAGLLWLCRMTYWGCTVSLRLRCIS